MAQLASRASVELHTQVRFKLHKIHCIMQTNFKNCNTRRFLTLQCFFDKIFHFEFYVLPTVYVHTVCIMSRHMK